MLAWTPHLASPRFDSTPSYHTHALRRKPHWLARQQYQDCLKLSTSHLSRSLPLLYLRFFARLPFLELVQRPLQPFTSGSFFVSLLFDPHHPPPYTPLSNSTAHTYARLLVHPHTDTPHLLQVTHLRRTLTHQAHTQAESLSTSKFGPLLQQLPAFSVCSNSGCLLLRPDELASTLFSRFPPPSRICFGSRLLGRPVFFDARLASPSGQVQLNAPLSPQTRTRDGSLLYNSALR